MTPSESFKAAITSPSSSEIFTLGELDSFARFYLKNASYELMDVLRLNFRFEVKYMDEDSIENQNKDYGRRSFENFVFIPPYSPQSPSYSAKQRHLAKYDIRHTI